MGNLVRFKSPSDIGTLSLRIAISDGHPGRVQNVEWTWPVLLKRLRDPTRDKLTLAEFCALPELEQLARKNNGYFVGAHFRGGVRKKILMEDRYLITFEIDRGTPAMLADLELGTSGLGDIEYAVYSTRKHSAEHPRVRVVIPLSRPLPAERFQAVSRILAHKLDAEMMAVDRVSFSEAQFMYWPSVCAGETFCFIHNEGPVLDAERVLTEWGKWQDYGTLPRSPREGELRATDEKTTDPRTKKGIVGAFCRTYDIHDTIAQFLPGLYTPSETGADGRPSRYTYTRGTTANGAVVYDDGTQLYSHHGTDPCGGRLVNAFDLRRLHEFGHLDDPLKNDVPITELTSYKAMAEALQDDADVTRELRAGNYGDDDAMWDDMPPEGEGESDGQNGQEADVSALSIERATKVADAATEEDWRDRLDTDKNGFVKSNLPNIALILTHAPTFKGKFAYDDFYEHEVQLKVIRSKSLEISVPGRSASDPVGRVREEAVGACRL
ncbi:MAG TPA: hypothetical protein VLJ39_09935, partial [Tepidisphaeraceae bacterium]|nr:hypothetical protein [Tepidisphaeraceae bacterium]